ncbi:hypothetical protein FRC02_001802 [Tulasnella sp. 418]|nr:hypothetical protein FRC02_001802 [Tulasnella sp. 418]
MTARSYIQSPPQTDTLCSKLAHASVPTTTDPCRLCPDPCDDSNLEFRHEGWGTKLFDVDLSSDMLGTVKPYRRQVVISTGKHDWEREVTEADGSLAFHLNAIHSKLLEESKVSTASPKQKKSSPVEGVFDSDSSTRLGILNGSHHSCSSGNKELVLVLPDYKVVKGVDPSQRGAEDLWKSALDPGLGRAGRTDLQMRSWVLPYNCLILLCSHKRRDNRCHIAAPVLKRALTSSLELQGWEVHDQVDDPEQYDDGPIENIEGTSEEREQEVLNRLKRAASNDDSKRALILFNSHIGGHKYAGNVIIYFPQGSAVWYGRVSSHEVVAVTRTITEGVVFPTLLRGGLNLSRETGKHLNDW